MQLSKNTSLFSILGGVIGSLLLGALFLTLSVTTAAPTVPPPDGNPDFLVEGPAGPVGPEGPQGLTGPQGPKGVIGNVRAVVLECNGYCYNTMPSPQQICRSRYGSTYNAIGYACECVEEPTIGGTTYINKSMTQQMACCDTSGEDVVVTCGEG